LRHIQLGNARITKFISKSPRRIVFRSPSAETAGGFGAKTVTVRSDTFGDAEAPAGFMYLEGGAAGVIYPSDIPLHGGANVVIEGPNLGTGEQYKVLLAGVEAKVLSASARKIEVQAGDARQYIQANQLAVGEEGLNGNVVIETLNRGKANGMDTQILFRYNPECRIDRVETMAGPADGETTLIITGHRLGMGDERIYVDGKPADSALTERTRQGNNIHQLSVRSDTAEVNPTEVVIKSARTGMCVWKSEAPTTQAAGK